MGLFLQEIHFTAQNPLGIEPAKKIIETEINNRLPGKKIKRFWEGDCFKLQGLGADGSIEVLQDQIRIDVKLKPPLSFMKDNVEKNLHEIIEKISLSDRIVADENDIDFLYQNISGIVSPGASASAVYLTNFGHIYHARPRYVVKPNNFDEVRALLDFSRDKNLPITIRGKAHSQTTHSISDDGLLIDTQSLDKISDVNVDDQTIWVETGVSWNRILASTYAYGLVPPVLTNNLEATVGGTLSIAGIGVASFKYGTQCDQIDALEIMTLDGEIHQCSRSKETELFWGILAGLGQIGILMKVKLRLRKTKSRIRTYYLLYDDLNQFLIDANIAMEKCDYFESWASPCPQGFKLDENMRKPFARWFYPLQLSVEFDADSPPNDSKVLSDLNPYQHIETIDTTTPEFLNRLVSVFDLWKRLGTWEHVHPWMETILPEETGVDYIETVLSTLPPGVNLGGHVLLWPAKANTSKVPLFIRPQTKKLLIGFGILAAVPAGLWPEAKINIERASDLSLAMGGKRYLSGYINFNKQQWKDHFGHEWNSFASLKRKFDPMNRLNPNLIPLLDE